MSQNDKHASAQQSAKHTVKYYYCAACMKGRPLTIAEGPSFIATGAHTADKGVIGMKSQYNPEAMQKIHCNTET